MHALRERLAQGGPVGAEVADEDPVAALAEPSHERQAEPGRPAGHEDAAAHRGATSAARAR